jgi:hypothetical protein
MFCASVASDDQAIIRGRFDLERLQENLRTSNGGNYGSNGVDAKTNALLCGVVALLLAYQIFGATETPSSALAFLQYVLIAGCLIGLTGAIIKINKPN